jgi:glutathione reductase (NADPH)
MDFDLFVIGGGSGGVRCARVAAERGARVAVAERRFWGGTCVNVGCVPKKLMVQGAEAGSAVGDARGFGWDTRQFSHDWGAMTAAIMGEVGRLSALYRTVLKGAGVTLFEADARLASANSVVVDGRTVTAETIVLATGGHPLRPEIVGAELGATSDDVFRLRHLPRRVTILGGGYIAVEFAGIFAGLGATVDLVYRQPLPLRGFDQEIREALSEGLAASGVRLHPARTIASLAREGQALLATTNDGHEILSDFVLFATGRGASTDGLGLDALGVAVGRDGAVVVDADRRTTVGNIYAIGDVVDHVNLTPVALAHGHILAERLFGEGRRGWNFDQVPTAVFSRPPIATVGLNEDQAAHGGATDIYTTTFAPLKHRLTGRTGQRSLMKLVVDHASGRLLGAHMMGDDAPEIIQGLAVAITAGATKADLDRTIGIHPTAAEEFVTLRTVTRQVGHAAAAQPIAANAVSRDIGPARD